MVETGEGSVTPAALKKGLRPGLWAGDARAAHMAEGDACQSLEENCPLFGFCLQLPQELALSPLSSVHTGPSRKEACPWCSVAHGHSCTPHFLSSPRPLPPPLGEVSLELGLEPCRADTQLGGDSLRKTVGVASRVGGLQIGDKTLTQDGPMASLQEARSPLYLPSNLHVVGTQAGETPPVASWILKPTLAKSPCLPRGRMESSLCRQTSTHRHTPRPAPPPGMAALRTPGVEDICKAATSA